MKLNFQQILMVLIGVLVAFVIWEMFLKNLIIKQTEPEAIELDLD